MAKENYEYEYNRKGDIIEIHIRDSTHRKIEDFILYLGDKKTARKKWNYIAHKYDLMEDTFEDPKLKDLTSSDEWINKD